MVPLYWLSRNERRKFILDGYEVIPIPGYRETDGYRAFKIIGPYSDEYWWLRKLSIPIWEDWKLTAQYVNRAERINSTAGIQMFNHLDDDEKIQALTHCWWNLNTEYHIKKYFREHPELLERARHSLNMDDIDNSFEDLL